MLAGQEGGLMGINLDATLCESYTAWLLDGVKANNGDVDSQWNISTMVAQALGALCEDPWSLYVFSRASDDEKGAAFCAVMDQIETELSEEGRLADVSAVYRNDWLIANLENIRQHFMRDLLKEITAV
jgi:hypothetical protein